MNDSHSKLNQFRAALDEWFFVDELTLEEVRSRLADKNCRIGKSALCEWKNRRKIERDQDRLLSTIENNSKFNADVEKQLNESNAQPATRTLIDLLRVVIMQLSARGDDSGLDMVKGLTLRVLQFEKLQQSERVLVQNAKAREVEMKQREEALKLDREKFAESMRTAADKGLDALAAEAEKVPEALKLIQRARELVRKSMEAAA